MKLVRLRVQGGKLVGDAPTSLADGTIVDALLADREDDMLGAELMKLNDALDESWAELEDGKEISAEHAIAVVSSIR